LDTNQVMKQSKAAYGQWAPQWREHAKIHSKFKMNSLLDLENTGIGKAILSCANGYSLEENIEVIKENKDKVDILCCDKSLGHLLDNGIEPTYCMVCDANVDYDKYLLKWKDKLKNTILLINVCANPKWTEGIEWKKIYFFINKDIIQSELEFAKLSGCQNIIAAATNVSNAQVVMLTQCENDFKRNFFGYDKILLIGYDYSWRHDGKYYAFDESGDLKADYMKHMYLINHNASFAYSSGNLAFSEEWLRTYITNFKLNVVCCSKETILSGVRFGDLKEQMNYSYKKKDSSKVRDSVVELRKIMKMKNDLEKTIGEIARDHYFNYLKTV